MTNKALTVKKLTKMNFLSIVNKELKSSAEGNPAGIEFMKRLQEALENTKGRMFQLPEYSGVADDIVKSDHHNDPDSNPMAIMVVNSGKNEWRLVLSNKESVGGPLITAKSVTGLKLKTGVISIDGDTIKLPKPKGQVEPTGETVKRDRPLGKGRTATKDRLPRHQPFHRPQPTGFKAPKPFNLSDTITKLESIKGVSVLEVVKVMNFQVVDNNYREILQQLSLTNVESAGYETTVFSIKNPTLQVCSGVRLLVPDVYLGLMYRIGVADGDLTVHPIGSVTEETHITELDGVLTTRVGNVLLSLVQD